MNNTKYLLMPITGALSSSLPNSLTDIVYDTFNWQVVLFYIAMLSVWLLAYKYYN